MDTIVSGNIRGIFFIVITLFCVFYLYKVIKKK
jgi:hypothetical protein